MWRSGSTPPGVSSAGMPVPGGHPASRRQPCAIAPGGPFEQAGIGGPEKERPGPENCGQGARREKTTKGAPDREREVNLPCDQKTVLFGKTSRKPQPLKARGGPRKLISVTTDRERGTPSIVGSEQWERSSLQRAHGDHAQGGPRGQRGPSPFPRHSWNQPKGVGASSRCNRRRRQRSSCVEAARGRRAKLSYMPRPPSQVGGSHRGNLGAARTIRGKVKRERRAAGSSAGQRPNREKKKEASTRWPDAQKNARIAASAT